MAGSPTKPRSIAGLPSCSPCADLLGGDHVAVLAAQADGAAALGVDEADDLLVDRAGQHHFDHLDRGLVGDAQAIDEFRLDAELVQHGADLRPAAMHHHRIDAGLFEQNHVAGEIARDRFVAHGVAAIFHHDDGVIVMQHVRQRLHQDIGLIDGGGLVDGTGNRGLAHMCALRSLGAGRTPV